VRWRSLPRRGIHLARSFATRERDAPTTNALPIIINLVKHYPLLPNYNDNFAHLLTIRDN